MTNFVENHKTYTKINTLYKRDEKGKIIIGDFSNDETKYIKDVLWLATEKIDGTNFFYYWEHGMEDVELHGKTSNANIPSMLVEVAKQKLNVERLKELFPPQYDSDGNEKPFNIRIYGEGYGNKIQKCGKRYISNANDIRLFDIMINDTYVRWNVVEEIAKELGFETVPVMGEMTIANAEHIVVNGFKSLVSEDKDLDAEGLVLRPLLPLYDHKGSRIMVKIKTCDYRKIGIKNAKDLENIK